MSNLHSFFLRPSRRGLGFGMKYNGSKSFGVLTAARPGRSGVQVNHFNDIDGATFIPGNRFLLGRRNSEIYEKHLKKSGYKIFLTRNLLQYVII